MCLSQQRLIYITSTWGVLTSQISSASIILLVVLFINGIGISFRFYSMFPFVILLLCIMPIEPGKDRAK